MVSTIIKKRFKAATAVLLVLLLVFSLLPGGLFDFGKDNEVEAAITDNIIYFDTYRGAGESEWSGWMNNGPVYIYAWSSSGNNLVNGLAPQMTETDLSSEGGSGYKVFSYDVSGYTSVRFLSSRSNADKSGGGKSSQRTEELVLNGVTDNCYRVTSTIGSYGRVLSSRNIGGSSAPTNPGYVIIPSQTGSGNQVFHDSQIVSSSTTQANTNVIQAHGYVDGSHANNNYFVGQYNYTGRYITYKSDFYDYYSDQEIYNTTQTGEGYKSSIPGSITNLTSNGWTDPFKLFNSVISSDATGSVASNILEVVIPNSNWLNATDGNGTSVAKIYAWSTSSGKYPFGAWSGKTITQIRSGSVSGVTMSGNVIRFNKTTLGLNSSDKMNLILLWGTAKTKDIENLQFGHRYMVSWMYQPDVGSNVIEKWDYAVKDLGTTYFGSSTGFTNPLYFGCFYVSNTNSDYTSTNAANYVNFDWLSNIGLRKDDSNDNKYKMRTSVRGLVGSTLSGGAITDPSNGNKLPYFDSSWVNAHSDFAAYWLNVDFPFYEVKLDKNRFGYSVRDNTGEKPLYYQFNSRDLLSLYLDTTESKLYEHNIAIKSQSGDDGATKGFYPFNKSNNANVNNLGFGVKYEIPFVLTPDGKIKGIDTTFEFMGDDDVWVFVDGQLALDMGGDHKDAYGVINFGIDKKYSILEQSVIYNSNGNPTLSTAANNITFGYSGNQGSVNSTTALNLSADSFVTENGVQKYNTSKVHTLTMFFMERGMLESDNFIRFNFIKQNVLDVKSSLDVSNINDGFKNKTREAANYDVFDYTLTNTNISARQDETLGNYLSFVGGLASASRTVKDDSSNLISATTTALNPASLSSPTVAKNTGNFSQNEGPVSNTLFERTDDYLTNVLNTSLTNPDPNYAVGKTDSTGTFGLLFAQDAIFRMQFYSDSTMTLKQEDALRLQQNLTTADALENSSKITSSTRTVSTLYKSKWSLKDNDGNTLGENNTFSTYASGVVVNDSTKTPAHITNFTFQNFNEHASIGVSLKAEVVNQPLTGGLTIKKQIVNKGTTTLSSDSYTGDFTIRVKFKDVFGQDSTLGNVQLNAAADYTGIKYTISGTEYTMVYDSTNNCGTITLKNGQIATITGIPINTKYEISEASDDTYALDSLYVNGTKVTANNGKKAEGTISDTATPDYDVNNTPGLGSIVVTKQITGVGASSDAQKFPVTLNITAPAGVSLSTYFTPDADIVQTKITDLSHNIVSTAGATSTITFKVINGSRLRINNLPYGTTYTVTEDLIGIDGYTQTVAINDGDKNDYKVNTDVETVTITNKKDTPTFTLKLTKRWSGIEPGSEPDIADEYKTVYFYLRRKSPTTNNEWEDVTTDKDGNPIGEHYVRDHDIKVVYTPGDVADGTGNITHYTLVSNLPMCDENGNFYTYRALEYSTSKQPRYSEDYYDTTNKFLVSYEGTRNSKNGVLLIESDANGTVEWGAVNTGGYVAPIVMPTTGGTPLIWLLPFGILAITVSGVALVIYKKKLQGVSLNTGKKGRYMR